MSNKFKVGDKVKVINSHCSNYLCKSGTILRRYEVNIDTWYITSKNWSSNPHNNDSSQYVSEEDMVLIESIPRKVYNIGDEVIFNTKKGRLNAIIESTYLNVVGHTNDIIFEYLKIDDRCEFCKNIYGYPVNEHDNFPEYNKNDMEACNKVINALLDLCEDDIKYIKVKPIIIKYTDNF